MPNKNQRKSIPMKVSTLLWIKAGGRCEYDGCNQLLYRDDITMAQINRAYIAHIVADSPDGPRGDKVKSKELDKDISNLMLLCDTHHRLIDKEQVAEHTVERLTEMKIKHEQRIERLTSIHNNKKSLIVTYGANIATNKPLFQDSQLKSVVSETHYPAEDVKDLGLHSMYNEKDSMYWQTEIDTLKWHIDITLDYLRNTHHISHISLFALAPMPLLVKLGTLLPELYDVEVYQKFREPNGWTWQSPDSAMVENPFIIRRPSKYEGMPVFVLSISASITKRIHEIYKFNKYSLWEISIENPHLDALRYKRHLLYFRDAVKDVLRDIKLAFPFPNTKLNVHMAIPNSCAVELGRVWMPKADLPLVLFDFNNGKEYKTIEIINE